MRGVGEITRVSQWGHGTAELDDNVVVGISVSNVMKTALKSMMLAHAVGYALQLLCRLSIKSSVLQIKEQTPGH